MSTPEGWRMVPVPRVRDVRRSAAYCREQLGFDCGEGAITEGGGDEGAIYAILERGPAMIPLGRRRTGHEIDTGRPPSALGAYVYVSDLEALHDELRARGAEIVQAPRRMPWGPLEMTVRDPDGYHLVFGASGETP